MLDNNKSNAPLLILLIALVLTVVLASPIPMFIWVVYVIIMSIYEGIR